MWCLIKRLGGWVSPAVVTASHLSTVQRPLAGWRCWWLPVILTLTSTFSHVARLCPGGPLQTYFMLIYLELRADWALCWDTHGDLDVTQAVSGWWWEAARLVWWCPHLTPHIALCGHFLPCNEQQCQPAGDQPDVTFSTGWNYNPVLMWSWEIFDGNVLINILNERPSYQYYRARWWT